MKDKKKKTKMIGSRISEELHKKFRLKCTRESVKAQAVIEQLIEDWVKKRINLLSVSDKLIDNAPPRTEKQR